MGVPARLSARGPADWPICHQLCRVPQFRDALDNAVALVAEGDCVIGSYVGDGITGAVAEADCTVVADAGVHSISSAVAECDCTVERSRVSAGIGAHSISGAVAEGIAPVDVELGKEALPALSR